MAEPFPEDDHAAQIRAIFADPDMAAAMRKRMPNQGKQVDPSIRDRRWDAAVDAFCGEGSDWWAAREPRKQPLPKGMSFMSRFQYPLPCTMGQE